MLPDFTIEGVLPRGDYTLTIDELKKSLLVIGPADKTRYPGWNAGWRTHLVNNLQKLVSELHQVGITDIFVDGSFAEDKERPNDIDGYFVCDLKRFASGDISPATLTCLIRTRFGHGIRLLENRFQDFPRSNSRCGITIASNSILTMVNLPA